MFPFLRRNTPASPAGGGAVDEPPTSAGEEPAEVLEVHQGWTDPIVQAVRGVGLPADVLPHTGDVVGYVETRPTERFGESVWWSGGGWWCWLILPGLVALGSASSVCSVFKATTDTNTFSVILFPPFCRRIIIHLWTNTKPAAAAAADKHVPRPCSSAAETIIGLVILCFRNGCTGTLHHEYKRKRRERDG